LCEHDTIYRSTCRCLSALCLTLAFATCCSDLLSCVLSHCKWYPSITSFFSLIYVRPRCTITMHVHS
jgi:hypothetical protein